MSDDKKCEFCGGGGTRRYMVTSPMFSVRSVYVCDACSRRLFVTTDEACEVLLGWESVRVQEDE